MDTVECWLSQNFCSAVPIILRDVIHDLEGRSTCELISHNLEDDEKFTSQFKINMSVSALAYGREYVRTIMRFLSGISRSR